MRILHFLREAILTTLFTVIISSTACAVEFTWTGAGDGETWEDPLNWEPNGVPDDDDDDVNFESFSGMIRSDGTRGAILTFEELRGTNSLGLDFDFEASGTGMRVVQKAGRAGLTFDTTTVTINAPLDLQTDAGNDTVSFNFFAQQFGFTSVTFNQPITTNDNNVVIFNPTLNSVLVGLNEDFAGGNTGNVSVDGPVSLGVDKSLTSNILYIDDGDVTLINSNSQVKSNILFIDDGSLNVKGGTTPTNPLSNLTNPIDSSGGRISQSGENVSIPQGFHISGRRGSVIDLQEVAAQTLRFDGPLTRQQGSTLSILANASASVEVASVEGADANGVLPYATFNNTDFAMFIPATGEIVQLSSYTPLPSANPGDAAEAVGGMSLPGNKQVSVLKLSNAVVNGGGNTLTTDGILVKGVNASLLNMTIMPHDQPGTDPNELIIHAPVGGDRLTLTNVDVADNNDPTELTFNAPQGGRVTVNDALTHTGGTNITSGTVILNGPDAALGTGDVYVAAGALVRLINNTFQNNLVVGTGPFPAKIEADGDSTMDANIVFLVNSRNDRAARLTAPQFNDSLTITGTFTRGGTGNPIEGHGKGIVQLGETFGDGPINVANTANLTDPNLEVWLQGDGGRNFTINGQLGNTVITGDVEVAGIGSATTFTDVPANGNTVGFSPGSSIGTFTVVQDMLIRGSNFTYNAEVDDAGGSDLLAVGGTLDISTPTDTLDISFFSGTTLSSADYTLATYGELIGDFTTVMFDGAVIADPTAPGAIGGTHRLLYGANALVLTTAASLSGDFDADGDVDGRDFLIWQRGESPDPLSASDLTDWQGNYGVGSLASSQVVPEPASAMLLLLGLLCSASRSMHLKRGEA